LYVQLRRYGQSCTLPIDTFEAYGVGSRGTLDKSRMEGEIISQMSASPVSIHLLCASPSSLRLSNDLFDLGCMAYIRPKCRGQIFNSEWWILTHQYDSPPHKCHCVYLCLSTFSVLRLGTCFANSELNIHNSPSRLLQVGWDKCSIQYGDSR